MRKFSYVLVVLLVLVLGAAPMLAYVSDRHDFGEIDFQGATVHYIAHFNALARFEEGGEFAGRLEEAKALFNIGDIVLVEGSWDGVGELALNRYLAGDSQYDIWRLPHNAFFQLASRGAMFPVSDILPPEYFEQLSDITKLKNERLRYDGKLLHFSVGAPDDWGHAPFVVVNLDMFERENLGNPYELYEAGLWDWDHVEEIARKATRDTTGDGVIDQWGFAFIDPYFLIFSNGGTITRLDEDGRVVFSLGEPAALEGLRKRNEWVNVEGISYGDWQMREFITGQTAMGIFPFWQIIPDDFDFNHGVLPLPKGPHVDDYVFAPGVADAIYLPNNSAYPLGLVALDNFLFPLEEYYEIRELEISHRVRDYESYTIMQTAFENLNGDVAYYHNFLGNWWEGETPYGGIIAGINDGRPVATVVGEFAPPGQALIDEYLKQ
ncbi:MAG: extracellular solute-binding protein [Bacillota bacterium]|jgi:ABC-type glycerol-3-phosphate transport system substrate-binding protein|nr:extracellular solute-binding protein [Bacillota bacterium]HHT91826.1 extracellular solute-binding protein [Bacillota bacterium]